MPIVLTPKTEQEWLELKAQDVSSTEVSALFNLSPYLTELELFYEKQAGHITRLEENTRMKWGKRLEAVIAQGVAEDYGLKVRAVNRYLRHDNVARMGSSFDFEIVGVTDKSGVTLACTPEECSNEFQRAYLEHGAGILEIKNVDGFIYRDKWSPDEAPVWIETQVQHQLEVMNREWVMICPLIGGNDARPFLRMRDRETGEAICNTVAAFWRDVEANNPPEPDYERDADFLIAIHQRAGEEILHADNDDELSTLMAEYDAAAAAESSAEKLKKTIKAQILEHIGDDVSKVLCNGFTLSCGMTKDTPPTLITAEMVGQTYGGRNGYRNFRLNKPKAK